MRRDLSPYQRYTPSEITRGNFPGGFLENFFNNSFMAGFNTSMRSDIKENEHVFTLEIEMPGYSKEDINVECQDGHLTITAVNSQDNDEESGTYVRQERQYGRVSRSYRIEGINEDKIVAEYRHGILQLTLPKSHDTRENKKRIDIH